MIASIAPKKKCYSSLGKGSPECVYIMCFNFHTHATAQIFGCTTKRPRKKRLPPDWQHDEMAEENSMDIEEGGRGHRRNSGVRTEREAWVSAWKSLCTHMWLFCVQIFLCLCDTCNCLKIKFTCTTANSYIQHANTTYTQRNKQKICAYTYEQHDGRTSKFTCTTTNTHTQHANKSFSHLDNRRAKKV